jgi:hypothetical protein
MRRLLLLVFILVLAGCGTSNAATVPAGTVIAGLDVGGLPESEAAARLQSAFGERLRSPVQVRVGAHRLHFTAAGGGIAFDAVCSVRARALCVTYEQRGMAKFLDRVERSGGRDPRDARLRYTVTELKVSPARAGYAVDRRGVQEKVEAALRDPHASRIVRQKLDRIAPEVTREDLEDRYGTVVTIHRRGFRLRLFKDLEPVAAYRVAVGMPGHETPRGRYEIANKAVDPAWSAPDRPWAGAYRNEVVAGGTAENPLKARWLGIVDGVGIHGTDAVGSLGSRASHGCIRMAVPDVKRLYERVPVGALVMIK